MKKILKSMLILILALAIMVGTCACGNGAASGDKKPGASGSAGNGKATVWRMAIDANLESIMGEIATAFKNYIDENSNGKYTVEIYANAVLGNDAAALESLITGNLEFAITAPSAITQYTNAFDIFSLPYVVRDDEAGAESAKKLMDGEIGQAILKQYQEDSGIKGGFITYSGFRNILNAKRDVAVPADIKGLKIRTMENPIHMGFYNELGATAVTLASSEAFTALQQGTIDGMDNVLDAMCNLGGWDSAKHVTLSEHFIGLLIGSMSAKLWDGLSAEDQALVSAAMQAASERGRELAADAKDTYVAKGKEMGVTFTEVDFSEWIPYAKKVWDDNRSSIPAEWFDPIYAELFG